MHGSVVSRAASPVKGLFVFERFSILVAACKPRTLAVYGLPTAADLGGTIGGRAVSYPGVPGAVLINIRPALVEAHTTNLVAAAARVREACS